MRLHVGRAHCHFQGLSLCCSICSTMRFGSTTNGLAKRVLGYHSLSWCAGHYATACGQSAAAASNFGRVAGDDWVSPRMRRLATLYACLAAANGQHPSWMGRAHALLAASSQHQQQQPCESLLEK